MNLVVASERLGKVGSSFDAAKAESEGVNISALIEGGHLIQEPAKKTKKDD
jgi:hypothetical protein